MIAATRVPKQRLCRACFDGEYPIDLPDADLLGKHLLESLERRLVPALGVPELGGAGAADALGRP
jgi:amidophosphoribosyltransferase